MSAAKKNSNPFTAKFPGTCSISGKRFQKGAQVYFFGDRIALVGAMPVVTGSIRAVAPVSAARKAKAATPADDGRPGRRPLDARADGRCRFCRTTPVQHCAMCGWLATPISVKITPVVQVVEAVPQVKKVATRAQMVVAVRACVEARDLNTAVALIVGMAGGPKVKDRANALASIDADCAKRGWLSSAEQFDRDLILSDCVKELKFNPMFEDGPEDEPAFVTRVGDLRQLPPAREPLKAGDWADLFRRVKAGELTEAEGVAFGQEWMKK